MHNVDPAGYGPFARRAHLPHDHLTNRDSQRVTKEHEECEDILLVEVITFVVAAQNHQTHCHEGRDKHEGLLAREPLTQNHVGQEHCDEWGQVLDHNHCGCSEIG